MAQTKIWDFYELQKVYKNWPGIKFNDLIMTIISYTLKEMFEEKGSKGDKLICAIPVNMRFPSKSLEDVKLSN